MKTFSLIYKSLFNISSCHATKSWVRIPHFYNSENAPLFQCKHYQFVWFYFLSLREIYLHLIYHINLYWNVSIIYNSVLNEIVFSLFLPTSGGLEEGKAEIYLPSYMIRFLFGAFLCLFSFSYSFSVGLVSWVIPAELFPLRYVRVYFFCNFLYFRLQW